MRYQGKITDWKDELGYGFVLPNGSDTSHARSQRVFVHIKHFYKSSSRPSNGDLITYELATDKNQRSFASNIAFVSPNKIQRKMHNNIQNTANRNSRLSVKLSVIFFAFLALSVLVGKLPLIIFEIYLTLSFVTFAYYAWDKSAAKHGRRRTPESKLHLLSLIGGWPGAALAQRVLRHKSVKREFQTVFWATVIVNCAAFVWLTCSRRGADFMLAIASMANSAMY